MEINSLINALYSELYEPKLLPSDLLKNLELPHYHSVKFKSENDIVIAITECVLPDGNSAIFKYLFTENKLTKLINVQSDDSEEVIYDRNIEIDKLRNKIKKSNSNSKSGNLIKVSA